MKMLHVVSFALVAAAGLNLGLNALLGLDLVTTVLGGLGLVKVFNILAGVGAVVLVLQHKNDCKACSK